MTVDHIRYDLLAQDALRGVVRTVLEDAARNGLPGDHHFYITFDTLVEGVQLSPRMLAQYPNEMTVVLQHQFWDLVISENAFQVGLSFGGIPERLVIPFAAIKGFFDPSVQFSLQFAQATDTAVPEPGSETEEADSNSRRPAPQRRGRPPSAPLPTVPAPATPKPAAATSEPRPAPVEQDSGKSESGAEVVRLDRFRKK